MRSFSIKIQHPSQKKYLAMVLVSMLVPSVVLSGCLYYVVFTLVAEELAMPESIYRVLLPVFDKVNMVLLVGLPVILAALSIWALYVSHRFAGPVQRIERELDEMLESGKPRSIDLRSGDDLKGIADRFNKLIQAV